jgi:hypothetical protein
MSNQEYNNWWAEHYYELDKQEQEWCEFVMTINRERFLQIIEGIDWGC